MNNYLIPNSLNQNFLKHIFLNINNFKKTKLNFPAERIEHDWLERRNKSWTTFFSIETRPTLCCFVFFRANQP